MEKYWWEAPRPKRSGDSIVLLGNSPAIGLVDLADLRRVETMGVNRILRAFEPTCYVTFDDMIVTTEQRWLTDAKCSMLLWDGMDRKLLPEIFRRTSTRLVALRAKTDEPWLLWPKNAHDRLIWVGNSIGYTIQLAVLMGYKTIGVLGVDFTANQIRKDGPRLHARTHFYGAGYRYRSSGGGALDGRPLEFLREAPAWAESLGASLINLSPYDDSPFTTMLGWPRMTTAEFVRRPERSDDASSTVS